MKRASIREETQMCHTIQKKKSCGSASAHTTYGSKANIELPTVTKKNSNDLQIYKYMIRSLLTKRKWFTNNTSIEYQQMTYLKWRFGGH